MKLTVNIAGTSITIHFLGEAERAVPLYNTFFQNFLTPDHCKDAEVQGTIQNLKTELLRYGTNAKEVIDAYMNHQCDEARLKIYISYFVNQVAAGTNYNCETEHAVFYLGNQDTRMMNFRFWLKYDPRTTAPRYPRESLAQMINSPMVEIKDGKQALTSLDLPKLRRPDESDI